MQRTTLTLALAALVTTGFSPLAALAAPMTNDEGAPVGDNQNSQTAGENGPVTLQDWHLLEKLARFDRERIPERVVHARGTGAHGVFESYADHSALTRAAFLNARGKQTPVFVRFSTVIHPSGSPETLRDPRGFATKFYTEQGNYDLVGNNLPVFFIRDAMKFPDMVHSLKPSPVTNKQDPNRFFDFFSHQPESTQMLTHVYSDLGVPASYRTMDGFGVHAFKWINAKGEVRYVKYKWTSQQGVKSLTAEEAEKIQGREFQHLTVDLYEQIAKRRYPSWELSVQMLRPDQLDDFAFDPLDATKVWPEAIAPAVKIGKMTLNRVPDNFFESTEQSAFSPGVVVPGIEPSEDRLLQGRLFSYADTQRHRLGANYQQVPVNKPVAPVVNGNQAGALNHGNTKGDVNYQPSRTTGAMQDDPQFKRPPMALRGGLQQARIAKTDNFTQAGDWYRALPADHKTRLIANLAGDLGQVKDVAVRNQMVAHFYKADVDYGTRLAKLVQVDLNAARAVAAKL
jgi:catalase